MSIKNFEQFTTDELQDEINRRKSEASKVQPVSIGKTILGRPGMSNPTPSLHPLALDFIQQIKTALKDFGEYTFGDKGADEVMDIRSVVKSLSSMDIPEIGKILSQVLDTQEVKYNFTSEFVSSVISGLDHMDDFEELFDIDDRFEY